MLSPAQNIKPAYSLFPELNTENLKHENWKSLPSIALKYIANACCHPVNTLIIFISRKKIVEKEFIK